MNHVLALVWFVGLVFTQSNAFCSTTWHVSLQNKSKVVFIKVPLQWGGIEEDTWKEGGGRSRDIRLKR